MGDLRRETARIRAGLVARGVGRGDRVAAYMPNIPETVAAFLDGRRYGGKDFDRSASSSGSRPRWEEVVRLGCFSGDENGSKYRVPRMPC